jgi:hypothetical protein
MNPQPWTDQQNEMYILDALIERGEVLNHCFIDSESQQRFLAIIKRNQVDITNPDQLLALVRRFDSTSLAREIGNHSPRYVSDMLFSLIRRLEYWRAKLQPPVYRQPSLWDVE